MSWKLLLSSVTALRVKKRLVSKSRRVYPWAVYCEGPPSFIWKEGEGEGQKNWRNTFQRLRSDEFSSRDFGLRSFRRPEISAWAEILDISGRKLRIFQRRCWTLGRWRGGGGEGERSTKFDWNYLLKFDNSGPLLWVYYASQLFGRILMKWWLIIIPGAVYCEGPPSFIRGRSQKRGTTIPVYNWHTHSKHIPVNSWHTLSKHATAAFISAALLSAATKLRRLAFCAFI